MATAQDRLDIYKYTVGLAKIAPGGYIGELEAVIDAGNTAAELAYSLAVSPAFTSMSSAYAAGAPNSVFAQNFLYNLLGDTVSDSFMQEASAVVQQYIADYMGQGYSTLQARAMVAILAIDTVFAASDSDPVLGAAKTQLDNRIASVEAYQNNPLANSEPWSPENPNGLSTVFSTLQNVVDQSGITLNIETMGEAPMVIMHLTGDQAVRIDFTNPANQIKGLDYSGDGTIANDGIENNVTGVASGFNVVDAYARNPLNQNDRSHNYLGSIQFDGTGLAGDGVSTDGNIFLGGLAADTAFGGIGNDFLAGGGGAGGDMLYGGRNADFFFAELSQLDVADGNGNTYSGGNTTDDSAAGLTAAQSGVNSQNNDWILVEASDDDEPVTINLAAGTLTTQSGASATLSDIESVDASGNLYGLVNDIEVELGARATDLRATAAVAGTENYGFGSTAQLNVTGSSAANVIIGGFDNDLVSAGNGDDIIAGGNLKYLLLYQNNPNLLDADGGLDLNVTAVGTVNDGRDNLSGGNDDDQIIFEMDGGVVNGNASNVTTSGDQNTESGDTLWLTEFSMGRMQGAMADDEDTAQSDALDALTSDSTVRIDLGNSSAVASFINYGGSNIKSQDQTNYDSRVSAVTMDNMDSVIATGLGAIDFKAAGNNSPELTFSNQQNFFAIEADLDLRGSAADNVLYANTGADVIEGRGGDDYLSGGINDDRFIVAFGDGVDTIHRQVDANSDNLWDTDSTGAGLFTRDFRAPQSGDISSSKLTVDFGATDLTSSNVSVGLFNIKIGGASFGISYEALQEVHSITALADLVNATFGAQDAAISASAVGNSILIVDTEGREFSDTIDEGFAVGLIVSNASASATGTYVPGGTPINLLEDDVLVIKTYDNRAINLGGNEVTREISNAASMVARFDATDGTQLAESQQVLVKLLNINEGDTITVTVNDRDYSYTAIAGDNSETAAAALVNAINNLNWDRNSASGYVTAANNAEVAEFDEDDASAALTDVSNDNAVISLTQSLVNGSQVFMNVSVSITNNLTNNASGDYALHNQSNTYVDLVGFDGRNGELNAEDVLFQGRNTGDTTVSVLQTALNAGDTLTGSDATLDGDTANAWINGDDLLIGGAGNDTINGGTGDDVIVMSAGTDTVDGGGNATGMTSNGAVAQAFFTDVLQGEEYLFGSGTRFAVTLDGTLGALGAGTVQALSSSSQVLGTTTFSNIETVRVLENSRTSTLDVSALSNNVATAVGSNNVAAEGLTVNMLLANTSVTYSIDGNNDGVVTGAAAGKYDATTGDYNTFAATQVFGTENVTSGNANDTFNLDHSQLTAANIIKAGAQQDNTTTYVEGADTVTYNHTALDAVAGTATTSDDLTKLTVKVESTTNTDTVSNTGGALGTQVVADTLVDVEVIDVSLAADGSTDVLDLSALSGAVVGFGTARTVQKSMGGVLTANSVANVEANTLESGGVSTAGSGFGIEKLEIAGITELDIVTGSASDDRIIIGSATGLSPRLSGTDVALGLASLAGSSTALAVQNKGLFTFNLGDGANDMLDYFSATDDVVLLVNTSDAKTHKVLVDDTAGGALIFTDDLDDRVDYTTGVERFFGSDTGTNVIDLTAATVNTTVKYSNETSAASNQFADPDGNNTVVTTDIVRGVQVKDTAAGTVFVNAMERTASNVLGDALWTAVTGAALAETVVLTDLETTQAHTLSLGAGLNVVDYSALTSPIAATIGGVNTGVPALTQTSTVSGDTVTQSHQGVAADNLLTIKGTALNGDFVDITALAFVDSAAAAPQYSTVDPDYHLVDLANGSIVESVYGQYGASSTGAAFVTKIVGFENASNVGDADAVHLLGNGSTNTLVGGNAADLIFGGNGTGTAVNSGDTLTGGAGADRFYYTSEVQSAGGSVTGNEQSASVFGAGATGDTNVTYSRDTISDFAVGVDQLVFQINDTYEAVKVTAAIPATLANNVTAVGTALFADGGTFVTMDIDNNSLATAISDRVDNYQIEVDPLNLVGNTIADAALRVTMSSGGDILDAGAGNNSANLNVAANDLLSVEFVYSAASESQGGTYDQIIAFTSGEDKIDLSFLKATRWEVDYGTTYDVNANDVSDAIEGIRTVPGSPIVAFNADAPGLFNDGGTLRAVAQQTAIDGNGDPSTTLFIDVNHDGNYTVAQDMVISLVGVAGIALGDIIFDNY